MPDITANYETPLDFILSFKEFSYIIDDYSCVEYYNFTKLSQNVCLIDTHNLVCRYTRCNCWK